MEGRHWSCMTLRKIKATEDGRCVAVNVYQ
jgi:hypothetical protein